MFSSSHARTKRKLYYRRSLLLNLSDLCFHSIFRCVIPCHYYYNVDSCYFYFTKKAILEKMTWEIQICTAKDVAEFRNMAIPNVLNAKCPKQITCDKVTRKYRTIDGTCNNLKRPLEGSSNTAQGRLLEAVYEDGISVPRKSSKLGGRLKSPRYISSKIMTDIQNLHKSKTSLLTYFGQIISHDYSITPMIKAKGEDFLCCKDSRKGMRAHPGCFTIPIHKKDKFYSKYKKNCMEFIRSTVVLKSNCRFGYREQQNAITTHMDGSFIYGSNNEMADKLRVKSLGMLQMLFLCRECGMKSLVSLSLSSENTDDHSKKRNQIILRAQNKLFVNLSGDKRANENIGLATIHTIFMREHNRIAKLVSEMKPSWDDEKIYQETRKIVIAFMQNMVMKEYLPIVMGKDLLNKYDLALPRNLDPNIYDPNINVEVSNAFSTAAFRFAHSMINDDIEFVFANGQIKVSPLEEKLFNTTDMYYPKRLNAIANGMLHQHPRVCSVHMASSMSKRLFLKEGEKSGLDLASLNIQRGRDHGLPGYNEYRKYCNFEKYTSISEMPITDIMKQKLRKVYKHVDDIDLFVGGLLEPIIDGAEVGETFGCILGEQFRILVKGDRFFYANGQKLPSSSERDGLAISVDTSKVGHAFTQGALDWYAVIKTMEKNTTEKRQGNIDNGKKENGIIDNGKKDNAQYEEFKKASLAQIICDNINIEKIQPQAMSAEGNGNEMVNCDSIVRPNLKVILKNMD
ncbi:Chorion peroxidase [Nymphon striatum]|nr:Chorion peroxidase [Nymphon striatum]